MRRDEVQSDPDLVMPVGWRAHPNSTDKFSRTVQVDLASSNKISAVPVTLSAKLRPDGGGWRWNIWLINAPGREPRNHVTTGWGFYRLEAAEAAEAELVALVARYRMGVL